MKRTSPVCLALALAALSATPRASAFSHVVKPGETLADIAFRVYGDAKKESVLAGANALDLCGGSAIVPGMRLEIPAPLHHRVVAGETWPGLALQWLGGKPRGDMLARANGAVSWVPPEPGMEVEVPAVLSHIVSEGDSSTSLAARYWGDGNRGWELNAYNARAEAPMHRGEIILVPLAGLVLTEIGMNEARAALGVSKTELMTAGLAAQRKVETELPLLASDVRSGHYVEAVVRANRLLGTGELTARELGAIHRALLEAYVALDAPHEASGACAALRANEPNVRFDPMAVSPKIRAACP